MKSFVYYCRFLLMLVSLVCGTPHLVAADIQAILESPANGQRVTGIGAVAGWAFSTDPQATVVRVRLRVNGQVVENGDIAWPGERGDVAATFPTVPQALNSGFARSVNFSELSSGSHKIGVEISDDRGGSAIIDHDVTVVRVGGFTFLSDLNLVTTEPNIDGRQIRLPFVEVTEKPVDPTVEVKTQQVTLTLGWQPDRQALGIIDSNNTDNPTTPDNDRNDLSTALIATPARDSRAAEGDTIRFSLENPSSGISTVSGKTLISGWAFSTTPGGRVTKIQLQVDDDPVQTIPCCTPRPDVAGTTENKDFPQALNSGFATEVNFNDLSSNRPHTLAVIIQTTDDKKTVNLPVTAVRLGSLSFIDQINLSDAEVLAQANRTIRIEKFRVEGRDANGAAATREVTADFSWNEDCQCFITLSNCGDGSVAPSAEECDGEVLNDASCTSLGFSGGPLACTEVCTFDTRGCTGGQSLYVTNVLDGSVSVVKTSTYEVTKTINVGSSPRSIAISPDGATAYVTNTGDDTLSIINTSDNTVNTTVKVGKGPQSVAVTPDSTKVYIVNGKADAVAVLNAATRQILPDTIKVGKEPQAIALTPDGTFAYVTNYKDDTVSVIDTRTNTVTATIINKIGRGPNGIAVSPDGKQAYVVNFDGNSISIVDAAKNEVVDDPITLGLSPVRVAFDPDGTRAYITSVLDFSMVAFDTVKKEKQVEVQIGTEPDGLAVSAKGKRVFVAVFGRNGDERFVDVISTITNAQVAAIRVGDGAFAVALTPPKP